jgi:hypothetical protein
MEKTKDTPIKKWSGSNPINCDICHQPFAEVFIDSRTVYGRWGLLCKTCHSKYGTGLGTGRGQKYDLKTMIKIEG